MGHRFGTVIAALKKLVPDLQKDRALSLTARVAAQYSQESWKNNVFRAFRPIILGLLFDALSSRKRVPSLEML
jgi:hypothetical protein